MLGMAVAVFVVDVMPTWGWNSEIENVWRIFHVPAWIIAVLIDGNPHGGEKGPVLAGVFLEWFVAGFVVSWLCNRGKRRQARSQS